MYYLPNYYQIVCKKKKKLLHQCYFQCIIASDVFFYYYYLNTAINAWWNVCRVYPKRFLHACIISFLLYVLVIWAPCGWPQILSGFDFMGSFKYLPLKTKKSWAGQRFLSVYLGWLDITAMITALFSAPFCIIQVTVQLATLRQLEPAANCFVFAPSYCCLGSILSVYSCIWISQLLSKRHSFPERKFSLKKRLEFLQLPMTV